MPIYEFQCEQCKEKLEVLLRTDAPPPEKCEKCGGALHKVIGGMTFHLHGPGFYTTDNKRKYLK
jgi:putative FmdB family regulatory protein